MKAACGKINDGTVHFLSMNIPNAMDIILTKNVPDDVAAKVEAARQDLRDGKIEFPELSEYHATLINNIFKDKLLTAIAVSSLECEEFHER